jgi:tetratricopeptide (TPR) repeat protein
MRPLLLAAILLAACAHSGGKPERPKRPKTRPEAVEAYLRGAHLVNKGPNNFPEALGLAREAVRLDPDYARGHFLLARILQGMGDFGQKLYAEVVPESRAEIRKAIELEPDLAEAHSLLSESYVSVDHDWEAAERAARKAQELDTTVNISPIVFVRGKVEEALAVNRRVLRTDPLNIGAITNVGRNLATLDRFEESLEWHRKAVAIEPENTYARFYFTWSAFQAGQLDVAAEQLVNGVPPEEKEPLREAYVKGGWNALCREALRLASSRPNRSAQQIAREKLRYGVFLKDNEMALDALEELEKTNDSWLAQLPDGGFRALRQEPRFKALLKRLRYPEAMWR